MIFSAAQQYKIKRKKGALQSVNIKNKIETQRIQEKITSGSASEEKKTLAEEHEE